MSAENLHRLVPCYEATPSGHGHRLSAHPERQRAELPALLSGGGGLCSTMDDYLKFVKFLKNECRSPRGEVLLSPHWLSAMTANQLPGGQSAGLLIQCSA